MLKIIVDLYVGIDAVNYNGFAETPNEAQIESIKSLVAKEINQTWGKYITELEIATNTDKTVVAVITDEEMLDHNTVEYDNEGNRVWNSGVWSTNDTVLFYTGVIEKCVNSAWGIYHLRQD